MTLSKVGDLERIGALEKILSSVKGAEIDVSAGKKYGRRPAVDPNPSARKLY